LLELKQWLGFDEDNDEEVMTFCQEHGLEVQGAAGSEDGEAGVIMDRVALKRPDGSIYTSAYLVMQKKGNRVLSEVSRYIFWVTECLAARLGYRHEGFSNLVPIL
jgi:hypothetical protein